MKEKKAKKEKKEKKEKKRKKSSGSVSGENKNKAGVEQINRDDYYRKATEFREWLRKSKGVYFEDLTSEKAKERFDSFVKRWNKGKLKDVYYNGEIRAKDSSSRFHLFSFEKSRTIFVEYRKDLVWIQVCDIAIPSFQRVPHSTKCALLLLLLPFVLLTASGFELTKRCLADTNARFTQAGANFGLRHVLN